MVISQQIKNLDELSLSSTAIGSLPHNNPTEAVQLAFNSFKTCPFWPQLSNVSKSEDMTTQYLQGLPGIEYDEAKCKYYFNTESETFFEQLEEFFFDYESVVTEKNYEILDKYAITPEYSSSINLFFNELAKTQPPFAKGHVIGPLTLGLSICGSDDKNAIYDDVLKEVIIKGLTLKALWQINQIKKSSHKTTPIIFLDEPAMSQYGTSAIITITKEDITSAIREISKIIQDAGGLSGVHCCGKTDWSIITDSGINILNFDAFFFGKSLEIYLTDIKKFITNGNYIAWGIVPTLDATALAASSTQTLKAQLDSIIESLCKKGLSKELVLKQSIFTPSCGAGGLDIMLAEKALSLTAEISSIYSNSTELTGLLK